MHRRLRRLRLLAASYLRVFLDNPHVGLVASNKYVCINACLNLPQGHNLAWQPCDDSCCIQDGGVFQCSNRGDVNLRSKQNASTDKTTTVRTIL